MVEEPDGGNKMIPRRGVSRDNRRENGREMQTRGRGPARRAGADLSTGIASIKFIKRVNDIRTSRFAIH